MKKTLLAIASLSLALFSGCGQSPKPTAATSAQEKSEQPPQSASPKKAARPKKRIHVPLSATFQNIISIGSVNIVYTQGDNYAIDLEGDSIMLTQVGLEVESGVLTLQIQGDSNKDINFYESKLGVTAYITTPGLSIVSLCESGNFSCPGRWSMPNIHIGCMSTGSFDVQELDCETFRYESTGDDRSTFHNLHAKTASIFAYRRCQTALNFDCERMEIDADGRSRLTLTGRVHSKAIACRGKAEIEDKTTEF